MKVAGAPYPRVRAPFPPLRGQGLGRLLTGSKTVGREVNASGSTRTPPTIKPLPPKRGKGRADARIGGSPLALFVLIVGWLLACGCVRTELDRRIRCFDGGFSICDDALGVSDVRATEVPPREDVPPPPVDRPCGTMCSEGQSCAPTDGGWVCNVCPSVTQTLCMSGCADLRTNPLNCGTCGHACSTAMRQQMTCANGVCACEPGWADCDGNAANGCETNPRGTSVNHCGRCGNQCTVPTNATAVCREGVCGMTCNAGWGDCDGMAATGCETPLMDNPLHCGRCDRSCQGLHLTAGCLNGACIGSCAEGYVDCDRDAGNGCETAFQPTMNCCAQTCMTGQACRPNEWAGRPECCLPVDAGCSRNDSGCCGMMACTANHCALIPAGGPCAYNQDCITQRCVANRRDDGGVCAYLDGGTP